MIYLQLFFAFMQIGAFSFGGGYAAMPLIESQVIDRYGWLTRADFADLVTIAEMTPGPIAINAATFVGNLTAGIPGALCATTGLILPPCIFATVLEKSITPNIHPWSVMATELIFNSFALLIRFLTLEKPSSKLYSV